MAELTEDMKQIIRQLAEKQATKEPADLGPVDPEELREHYRNINELKTGQTPVKTSSYDFPAEPEPSLEEIQANIDSVGADTTRLPAGEELGEIDETELKKKALQDIIRGRNG